MKRLPSMEDFRAQHTCLALKEGEVYEHIIEHEDNDELFSFIDDEMYYAEKLYVEDVLKRRYFVKESDTNIKKLFEFEREPNKVM